MSDQIGTGAELSRRGFLGFSAAAGASVLLASACDVGGSSKGGSGSGSGTIRALFMKQAGYSEDDIKGMVADFQKANPKIKVEPTLVAYDALHDKIVAAAPAATFDVVLIDVIWPAEFGSKHIVTDITSKVNSTDIKSGMFSGALTTADYRNHYYGLPWILDTKYLYYNKEHLQRANVDPASLTTWDAVESAAKKIKNANVIDTPLVWSWKQAEALICDYTQLLGAYGGTFLADDYASTAFQTGGGVDALKFMRRTLDEKLTNPGSTGFIEDDVLKTFSTGGASIALNWTYMWASLQDKTSSNVVGKVGIMRTPKGPSGRQPGVNGSMALCVSSGSKNQDAAWQFVKYLTSQKVQNKYAKSSLPCWKDSYTDQDVVKAAKDVVPVAQQQLQDLLSRPQVPRYNEMSQILQTELQNCLANGKDPQKALNDAANEAKPLLK